MLVMSGPMGHSAGSQWLHRWRSEAKTAQRRAVLGMRGLLVEFPSPELLSPELHLVILNLFQDDEPRSHVILKQVQDDERVANYGGILNLDFEITVAIAMTAKQVSLVM